MHLCRVKVDGNTNCVLKSVGLVDYRSNLLERGQSASIKSYDFINNWKGPWIATKFFILYQGTQIKSPLFVSKPSILIYLSELCLTWGQRYMQFFLFPSYCWSLGIIKIISLVGGGDEGSFTVLHTLWPLLLPHLSLLALSLPYLIHIPFSFPVIASMCARVGMCMCVSILDSKFSLSNFQLKHFPALIVHRGLNSCSRKGLWGLCCQNLLKIQPVLLFCIWLSSSFPPPPTAFPCSWHSDASGSKYAHRPLRPLTLHSDFQGHWKRKRKVGKASRGDQPGCFESQAHPQEGSCFGTSGHLSSCGGFIQSGGILHSHCRGLFCEHVSSYAFSYLWGRQRRWATFYAEETEVWKSESVLPSGRVSKGYYWDHSRGLMVNCEYFISRSF